MVASTGSQDGDRHIRYSYHHEKYEVLSVGWQPITLEQLLRPKLSRQSLKAKTGKKRTHAMATRAVTTNHAITAVIETRELLEGVLLQLPIRDLFKFRRVSTVWNSVILDLPKLEDKLLLRETDADEEIGEWLFDKTTRNLRPKSAAEQAYDDGPPDPNRMAWRLNQYRMKPSRLNPALFTQDPESQRPDLTSRAALCESLRFAFTPNLTLSNPSIMHSMLLCVPAVKEAQLNINYRRIPNTRRRQRFSTRRFTHVLKVYNSAGVRFGDVLEAFNWQIRSQEPLAAKHTKYEIEIAPLKGAQQTTVWLLGAIFVNNQEYEAVMAKGEKKKDVKDFSPLAKEMIKSRGFGVDDPRFHSWFSKADDDWVAQQEIKRFGRLAPV